MRKRRYAEAGHEGHVEGQEEHDGEDRGRGRLRSFGELFLGSELASILYVDEVLDGAGRFQYIDSTGSVSASRRRR